MRRRSLMIAVPAGLAVLAGCGDEKSDSKTAGDSVSPSPSAAASPNIVDGPLPAVTAGSKFGEKPTLAKGSGELPKDGIAVRTLITGSGRPVAEGDYIVADFLGQIWGTDKVFANSYDGKQPLVAALAQGQIWEAWRYGLPGKKLGSRVQIATPPAWGYPQGSQDAGVKGTDSLVFVIDLKEAYSANSSAQGKKVPQTDKALPTVGTNTDGKAPSIEVPKTDPPKDLVANYVIEGDGEPLKADSTVLVHYKGVLWDTGKEFDSSYSRNSLTSFSLQQVVKGWGQGLTGKKVGSRVLIVVPPSLGYGDNPPQGSDIKKDSTMVFTVDILAAI
ncbi:FKBP-type peptidyl-prolyl cis-trans isomerase [Streptomyces sp. NPDC006186]|uniref:FKBP-type peptidyl-prolyl cis-trans isomerase n=1 Tax=Streptomyces sp. NPDC006186 TaxID=3155248 RepID=UPI0033B3824F